MNKPAHDKPDCIEALVAYAAKGVVGAPGMGLGLLVLLYVVAKFGYETGGVAGAVLPVAAFLGIEAYLFWATRPSPGTWNTFAGG